MTTYQMIQDLTGAEMPLIKKAKKTIIGNSHTATTQQIHDIIAYIKKEQKAHD